jgi:predicted TIM-barrel fold metal-dependent hydrolase
MKAIEELGGMAAFRRGEGEPGFSLVPEPVPPPVRYPFISVDDHLVEPGDLFTTRVGARHREDAPRVVEHTDGREYWLVDGRLEPNVGGNATVGQGPEAPIAGVSMRFDEMRRGAWDIHARVRDMDLAGVLASLGFPSMVFGFCGQRFLRMRDADLALACERAYNDWVVDEWAAPYPDRVIPCQLTWLADVGEAARQIERNAARGFTAVAFSENPEKLGLPSIHTGYWDPFLAACEQTGTVVNLHVGSSSQVCHPSSDAPAETMSVLFAVNSLLATVDWLYSGIPSRFPQLQIALSEGGVGWVPMLLDRLDYVHAHPRTRDWTDATATPSDVLRRNFWFTSFYDPSMWVLRERIGIDHIVLEADYPHPDTTWPDTQRILHHQLRDVPADDVAKLTYANAARLYRHDVPPALLEAVTRPAAAVGAVDEDVATDEHATPGRDDRAGRRGI